MQFDDESVDASELEDQRGGGGLGRGLAVGGGPDSAWSPLSQPGGGTSGDVARRCNVAGAIDQYDDCFVLKAFNEINEVWGAQFARSGQTYTKPRLVYFSQSVRTGCGTASSQAGPFYCPPDRKVYIDLGFLDQLQRNYGA